MEKASTPKSAPIETALRGQRLAQAERFIEQSQDGLAIRTLANLRREPQSFMQRLKEAASHNQTLRLALGICLGIVAAEAITGFMRGPALDQALNQVDAWLKGEGAADEAWAGGLAGAAMPAESMLSSATGMLTGTLEQALPAAEISTAIDSSVQSMLDLDVDLDDWLS